MLKGIITEGDNHYYIHLEEKKNVKYVSIIHHKKNKIRCLNKEEAVHLLQKMFSSQLFFHEKKDEYDVYLDEANNKRYFKDGKEDFQMFFLNNGVDAIRYNEERKDNSFNIKRIIIDVKDYVFCIIISITVPLLMVDLLHPELLQYEANNIKYRVLDTLAYGDDLTVEEIQELINLSSHLTNEQKELLSNDNLFQTILDIADNKRDYSLRVKLDDIEIKKFGEEASNPTNAGGFYSPLEPNIIHIRDNIEEDSSQYNDILIHEFIHLLQSDNCGNYISEACAEIISNEYYNTPIDSYYNEVLRVKVLMEIIGPKPLLEWAFSGNSTSLEEEVSKYLDKEDTSTFMRLMEYVCDNYEEKLLQNDYVDELLAKMYFQKTGNNIHDDLFMMALCRGEIKDRIYFNSNREEYTKDYSVDVDIHRIDELSIYDVIDTDQVEKYIWYHKVDFMIDKDLNISTLNGEILPNEIESQLQEFLKQEVNERYSDNVEDFLNQVYNVTFPYETTYYHEIKPIVEDRIEVYLKDGTIISAVCEESGRWDYSQHYYKHDVIEPSIKEKFDDQFQEELSTQNSHHL